MVQPQCFLMIGLPGAGKTTKAREIEANLVAQRFTPDEYILEHYGDDLDIQSRDALRDPVEELLWAKAIDDISKRHNVVVDFGMWAIEERSKFRRSAEQAGAIVFFVMCEVDFDTAWKRVSNRPESGAGTLRMSKDLLKQNFAAFQPLTDEEQAYVVEPSNVDNVSK